MKRILLVDDSSTQRQFLRRLLESDPRLKVVAEAPDGETAVREAASRDLDLVVMDLHLPGLSGIEATRRIMGTNPLPIVVVSGTSDPDSMDVMMEAMAAGALSLLHKPAGVADTAGGRRLIANLIALADVRLVRIRSSATGGLPVFAARGPVPRLIVIAASTGGPAAVHKLVSQLPGSLPVPVLLVQHMATGFIAGFAQWLNDQVALRVCVAEAGAPLERGVVHIAADGAHTVVTSDFRIGRVDNPVTLIRPSADVALASAAEHVGAGTLAVILTGMGDDGALGVTQVRAAGGICIAQDESTSVVYGMPAAASATGCLSAVLPIQEIAPWIAGVIQSSGRTGKKEEAS